MNIQLFLDSVLPAQGRRFVIGKKNGAMIQRVAGTTSKQVVDATELLEAQGCSDLYFAVGGFTEGLNAKGQPSREAEYAQWHRCLRVDIDVQTPGENKPNKYTTKQEALQGLVDFINVLHLPMPIVIDSGGGFHVYWVFNRDITRIEWQLLADRLKAACVLHGLRADPTATADAARILRMPGTRNYKPHFGPTGVLVDCVNPNSPLLPMDPAQFDVLLPAAMQLQMAGVAVSPPRASTSPQAAVSELSAGVGNHTPYDIGSVIRECSVMTDMLAKHGDGYHNQQWYLMLNAVQASMHTDAQKRSIALVLSDGWRDNGKAFDINDFDRTFARAKNGHPFSCATMANSGEPASSLCRACPYYADALPSVGRLGYNGFQSKRNRVQLQQQAAAPVAYTNGQQVVQQGPFKFMPDGRVEIVDGKIGSGHYSIQNGKPSMTVPNGNGTATRAILDYVIKEVASSGDANSIEASVLFARNADTDVSVTFNGDALSSTVVLNNVLTNNRILAVRKNVMEDFRVFMSTFLHELQKIQKASHILSQCGWTDSGDFVWGFTTFHTSGSKTQARPSAKSRLAFYNSGGDKTKWQQAFDIILNSGADRQALLALGIASPLMKFTDHAAVMVNMLSESGTGKTTTSDAIQSIWGNPERLRLALHDTDNSIYKLAGITGSLPLVLDEKTISDGENLFQQVHTLTQGREKHRMDAKANVADIEQYWKLIAFTSSNSSVIGRLLNNRNSDTGGPARVFEINMGKLGMTIAEQSANKPILQGLKDNFGWMAPDLCQLLVGHSASYWQNLVAKKVGEWDKVFNGAGENRYHSAAAALAEIGAAIGAALGYGFNVQAVKDEMLQQWRAQQALVKSVRFEPLDYVRSYYLDKGTSVVQYMGTDQGRRIVQSSQAAAGEAHIPRPPSTAAGVFIVREQQLREYVIEKKGQWDAIKKSIEADPAFLGRNKRNYLANAPGEASAYVMCYEFDLRQITSQLHAVPTAAPTTQVLP